MPSKKNTLMSFTNLQGASNCIKLAREINYRVCIEKCCIEESKAGDLKETDRE